jgi:hypothetical protein
VHESFASAPLWREFFAQTIIALHLAAARFAPLVGVAAEELCRQIARGNRIYRDLRGDAPGNHCVDDAAAGQRIHLPRRVADQHHSIADNARGWQRDRHIPRDERHRIAARQIRSRFDEAREQFDCVRAARQIGLHAQADVRFAITFRKDPDLTAGRELVADRVVRASRVKVNPREQKLRARHCVIQR